MAPSSPLMQQIIAHNLVHRFPAHGTKDIVGGFSESRNCFWLKTVFGLFD